MASPSGSARETRAVVALDEAVAGALAGGCAGCGEFWLAPADAEVVGWLMLDCPRPSGTSTRRRLDSSRNIADPCGGRITPRGDARRGNSDIAKTGSIAK